MEKKDYIQAVDCLEGLKQLPDASVQCCVTSPPYFRLRDYGMERQVGMENTPEQYVERMVGIFDQVKRVLKPDGVLWLNLGDSYWGSGKAGNNPAYQAHHMEFGEPSTERSRFGKPTTGHHPRLKPKDLVGVPWAVAFALRDSGWWLRQDIIWAKRNGMPESISDRCTRSHEYIFMLTRSATYFYNAEAIKTDFKESSTAREQRGKSDSNKYSEGIPGSGIQAIHKARPPQKRDGHGNRHAGFDERWNQSVNDGKAPAKANRRSVWSFSTKPFKGQHFATFPLEIPRLCIQAGSREGDIVLDPFAGAGTTPLAAASLNRHYIGFELNPLYAEMARARLKQSLGLFYLEDE